MMTAVTKFSTKYGREIELLADHDRGMLIVANSNLPVDQIRTSLDKADLVRLRDGLNKILGEYSKGQHIGHVHSTGQSTGPCLSSLSLNTDPCHAQASLDVFDNLAAAVRDKDVMISVTVSPYGESE